MTALSEPTPRRSFMASLATLFAAALTLSLFPGLKLSLFAGSATQLAGLFFGTPVCRLENGWMLPSNPDPILVTSACSGADFWLIAATLWAWQIGHRHHSVIRSSLLALIWSAPFSILANSLRLVAVMQAHRWFIPLWPQAYASFFHLLTGVAVFLPSLIILHVYLENSRSHRASPST
jgi:exosortase/archaeosortase family protein